MITDKKDFNALVDLAMANNPTLSAMRPVVVKELLHHEIFQALDADALLKGLVFQGGTSLRLCRGSPRFSEDLDFAGGAGFSAASMDKLKSCLETRIGKIFDLEVAVRNKPSRVGEDGIPHVRVEKWWVSIETAPENRSTPRQKVNLEIANVPAHTSQLVPIRDRYGFLAGATVLVNAESLVEVMADKVLAFPTSLLDNKGKSAAPDSNKIRHRDIWDLAWMQTQGAALDPQLVLTKIADYRVDGYPGLLDRAIQQVPAIVKSREFKAQMSRFIDSTTMEKTLASDAYLDYLETTVTRLFVQMRTALAGLSEAAGLSVPTTARSPDKEKPKAKRRRG